MQLVIALVAVDCPQMIVQIPSVFATEVSWDGSQWSVTNDRFDAAGSMHASNEFIWFHNDEVNGFPEVSLQAPAVLPSTGGDAPDPYLPLLAAAAGLLLIGGGLVLHRRLAVAKQ